MDHYTRRKLSQRELWRLHDQGEITHATLITGLTVLWRMHHVRDEVQVSYERIAKAAHVARSVAQAAMKKLRKLKVLTWRPIRLRIVWGDGFASRQWRNVYQFVAPITDTDSPATNQKPVSKQEAHEVENRSGRGPQPPVRSVQEQIEFCLRPG